jgi:hypothetical protein
MIRFLVSQGHGSNTSSSGSSTSLVTGGGTLTPVSADDKDSESTVTVSEKLQRKGSFQKARIFGASSSDLRSTGVKKEHQEQCEEGRLQAIHLRGF